MSEYSRRILAFSAIAIILGISVSVGIAFLPSATKSQSSVTQVSTQTLASTVVQSSTATVTTTLSSTTTAVSSSASTITEGGTTILTTISSVTTVLSSSSTVVSTTVSSSSATSSSVSQTANSSTTVTSSTTASCFVQGYPDGIYLQILTNSGAVISGLMVSGQSTYIVNGQECTNSLLTITNSTGWAYLGSNPGIYYVSFSYSGNSYNLTIPSQPVTESVATYYVPSGNLTIEYCTYGNPQMCSS